MQAINIKESKASKKAKKRNLLVSRIGALEGADEDPSSTIDDDDGDGNGRGRALTDVLRKDISSFSGAGEEDQSKNGHVGVHDSDSLVIPVPAPRNNDSSAFKDYDERKIAGTTTTKKLPLLMANVPPALLGTQMDDGKKFKLDMSLRPKEASASSKMYESVPVEKFGAALLRGMGWTGPSPDEAKSSDKGRIHEQGTTILGLGEDTYRERRLGLGATAKPKDKLKKGQAGALPSKTKENWKKMAEEKIGSQIMAQGDIVIIREGELAGRKAKVSKTDGVPGLNRFRVTMEANGAVIELNKTHVALVSKATEAESKLDRGGTEVTMPGPSSNKRRRESESDAGKGGEANQGKKKSKHDVQDYTTNYWLMKGIRVRFLSEESDAHHLKKGFVIEVDDSKKEASVQLDSGAFLGEVKQKNLETVLPSTGKLCYVLCGPNRGRKAQLLEKIREKEIVRVEISETLDVVTIPMDFVAAIQ